MISDKQIAKEIASKKKSKQKSSQDIFHHLLDLYQPLLNKICSSQVILEVQDLYQIISNHPKTRSQKVLKKIKSELNQMRCFKIAPINQSNPQFNEIFKRDNANILNMISPFIEMTKYQKGSIAEATGFKRNSIKILLFGQVTMFESLNYRTFKNCQLKIKNGQINTHILDHSKQILSQIFAPVRPENPEQFFSKQGNISNFITQLSQQKMKTNEDHLQISPRNQNEAVIYQDNPENFTIGQVLTKNQCRMILAKCGLISPLTPHKYGKQFDLGDFIFDKDQPMFIDQKPQYYSSVVCNTDCFFLQIGFQIAKQVIQLINSDRQRPYIQALLFKFPMLKYFEAKQYVTPQFMIAQEIQQQEGVKVTKKLAIQTVKELKIVSSLNFQLSFTGDLYIIISGQVTLVIDQISQKKSSTIQYAIAQKSIINKQILHLYKNDIFGFEQIGLNKQVNLRYLATIGSKLLKINRNMFKHHLQTIFGFKKEIEKLKAIRNEIIIHILENMQEILQNQQLKRHQSITYSKSESKLAKIKSTKSTQLTNETKEIMQLRYYGRQKFNQVSDRIKKHFSPQNTDIAKQGLSPQIVKQNGLGIEFAQNLLKRPSQHIEIKDGWIQIRNNKGTLLRKKKIKQSDQSANAQKGDALLRKLGILSSKQIADHNHQIVKKRPSKYQFRDLQKEAKQFQQIRHKVESLPKLTNFFAKKQNRVFSIIYKRTHF